MAASTDIKSDSNGDLFIDSLTGDFKIDFSDEQHIQDIIEAVNGDFKEFPTVGVGIEGYLNSSGTEQEIQQKIKLALQADGYILTNPFVEFNTDGTLNISPNAIRK